MTLRHRLEGTSNRNGQALVHRWTLESNAGRISGRDANGDFVIAIAVDRKFGSRLAAAFDRGHLH